MRADSLAATPRLSNAAVYELLAHLFLLSIQYFYTHPSPKTDIFINQLRVLVGLSYAAFHMADISEKDEAEYQKSFCRFIQYSQGDFRLHWGGLLMLANAIANLVIFSIESFHRINYPTLYHSFMQALGKALNNEFMTSAGRMDEVQRLLHSLQTDS